jgi:transposase-like protein
MRGLITPNKIDKNLLRKWYGQGVTVTEVARRFGCSQQRVCQVVKKLGLSRPAGYKPSRKSSVTDSPLVAKALKGSK